MVPPAAHPANHRRRCPARVTLVPQCGSVAIVLTRAWSLLLMLLLSSLVLATTVHARESAGPATIECSEPVHGDGDAAADTDGDTGKAALHHHGNCHAGTFSMPQRGTLPILTAQTAGPATLTHARGLPSRAIDPGLRPPAA